MAHLEAALYTRLGAVAGLTALINDRIYYQIMPQNVTLPAITLTRVSSVRHSAHGADTGVAEARVQIACWGAADIDAKDVKEQVRAALQRHRATVAGVELLDILVEDERDLEFDEPTRSYGTSIDFRVFYRES